MDTLNLRSLPFVSASGHCGLETARLTTDLLLASIRRGDRVSTRVELLLILLSRWRNARRLSDGLRLHHVRDRLLRFDGRWSVVLLLWLVLVILGGWPSRVSSWRQTLAVWIEGRSPFNDRYSRDDYSSRVELLWQLLLMLFACVVLDMLLIYLPLIGYFLEAFISEVVHVSTHPLLNN